MARIVFDKVSKKYPNGFHAVKALDLVIEDKEFVVLLGPSGCGKSTTLNMIAGLEQVSDGGLWFDDQLVNDMPAHKRDVAMVFQSYALYPHKSVYENIAFGLQMRGAPKAEIDRKVRHAAERLEISPLLDRRPSQLSGGQRQRVALGRAMVREPEVFLMDEPLSNLDAKLRTVMRAELKHLQQTLGTTTVYVTHDQVEAMTLADRIVILNRARIQQVGTPQEVYTRPANTFVAGFIGSPPMNLLEGTVADGAFRHQNGAVPLAGVPAGPVVLGERPEDLRLAPAGEGHLSGSVYSSELLGDSTLVNVELAGSLVAVKVGPEEGRRVGEAVDLLVDPGKIHLFAKDTGERLPLQR